MDAKPGMVVSIRWIVTLVAVALTASAVLGVGAVGEHATRQALTAEIETRILVDARMLATASTSAMLGDFPELTLHPLIRQMRERQPELATAFVIDRGGMIQGHDDARLIGSKHVPLPEMKLMESPFPLGAGEKLMGDEQMLLASCTVAHPNGQPMGTAFVGIRRDFVSRALAEARQRQLLFLGLFLVAGIVIASVLMSHLLKPMGALRKGIERIGQGDLDTPVVLTDRTELRLLGSAINDMAGQLKAAQRKLVRNNRALTLANENLKELDRLKSEFLRNVNHELRTPLTVIIAYLSHLQERNKSTIDQAELSESIEVTLKESWKLKGLLEHLLEFSAASSDSLAVDLAAGDLASALASYHAERLAALTEGKRTFVFEAEGCVPEALFDQRRLTQALDSLLDNAVKFTPPGTHIQLRLGVEAGDDGKRARVVMEDNGPGVPPEQLPILFKSFRQLDGSMTREVGGMGLGLALTKQLVEKMGGTITVQSRPGAGTAFTILLPIAGEDYGMGPEGDALQQVS